MKKSMIATLVGLALTPHLVVAETIDVDDVVVTATRTPQPKESVLADVSVIHQEEIQRAGQSNLIEVLQRQPGIEVSSTGGAGKLSGIFMRGTNSNHVVVLIDGIRINNVTSGTTAFENIPVELIDRVEILRGPAASLYGQDAIGGVIQVFTKKGSGKPKLYAGVGYGTYKTKKAQAGIHGAVGDTRFALGLSSEDTDGFSAYKTSSNNPQDQNFDDDDGYRNLSVTGSLSHEITDGHEVGLNFLHSKGKVDFDARFNVFADDPAFEDNAETTQHSYSLYTKNAISSNWLSTIKFGQGFDEYTNFSATSFFVPVSRSEFRTRQRQLSWQHDFTLPVGTVTAAYDRLEERLKSTTEYDKTKRTNDGFYLGYFADIGNHTLHANYRHDNSSQYGTNNTQSISYGYRLNQDFRASISYGKAFNAPSFNFLYFPFSSNPNLVPEKSDNIEAALRYETDNTEASITVFSNKIRNLILSDASTGFTPFNVSKAKIEGVTLAANHHINNWDLGGSIDIQSPKNRETEQLLPRRANRHAKANIAYQWDKLRIGGEAVSSSRRYSNADNQRLAGYTIYNLTSEYAFNNQWKLQARVNNLFDKDYALAYDGVLGTGGYAYNTPGTNLFVNLRWESN